MAAFLVFPCHSNDKLQKCGTRSTVWILCPIGDFWIMSPNQPDLMRNFAVRCICDLRQLLVSHHIRVLHVFCVNKYANFEKASKVLERVVL